MQYPPTAQSRRTHALAPIAMPTLAPDDADSDVSRSWRSSSSMATGINGGAGDRVGDGAGGAGSGSGGTYTGEIDGGQDGAGRGGAVPKCGSGGLGATGGGGAGDGNCVVIIVSVISPTCSTSTPSAIDRLTSGRSSSSSAAGTSSALNVMTSNATSVLPEVTLMSIVATEMPKKLASSCLNPVELKDETSPLTVSSVCSIHL